LYKCNPHSLRDLCARFGLRIGLGLHLDLASLVGRLDQVGETPMRRKGCHCYLGKDYVGSLFPKG